MAYMDYMDPDVLCPQKADKLNLSLWANVDPDLCRQMASLGLNELTHCDIVMPYGT